MSDNFKWTDELIKEYISKKLDLPAEHHYHLQQLEEFKKSKQLEMPKEWEILSFISSAGYVAVMDKDGLYKYATHGGWTLDVMLKDMKIHSVKRLPDGEVFTVGDEIEFGTLGDLGDAKIERFEISYFDKTRIVAYNGAFGRGLSVLKKVEPKEPLFTTEDGVDILSWFDVVWHVDKYWYVNPFQAGGIDIKESKCFSKEEKAIDYIIENKPVSITYKELYAAIVNQPLTNIKDFFKSKINP